MEGGFSSVLPHSYSIIRNSDRPYMREPSQKLCPKGREERGNRKKFIIKNFVFVRNSHPGMVFTRDTKMVNSFIQPQNDKLDPFNNIQSLINNNLPQEYRHK